jgi:CheY-specific phosphatase CheX
MAGILQIEEHLSEQARIAAEVLGVMADIVAEPVQTPWPPKEELVTAAIYFTEPWKGAMLLECVLPLAFEFTSRLMSVPPPSSVDADVCDSMGELVNMIAGNFKALMPAETGISIPSVVKGRDYLLQLRGSKALSQIVFRTELGEFCLTLMGVKLK